MFYARGAVYICTRYAARMCTQLPLRVRVADVRTEDLMGVGQGQKVRV